jgi:hypothetical protein
MGQTSVTVLRVGARRLVRPQLAAIAPQCPNRRSPLAASPPSTSSASSAVIVARARDYLLLSVFLISETCI